MEYITETRQVPVQPFHDVIVVGGGVAGAAAAVAAARQGSRVLLIEKSAILGGLATLGLIAWYEPLCDGEGHQMIGGIAEELLRLAIRYGYDSLPGEWREGSPEPGPGAPRYATHFSPNLFALALDRWLAEAGVELRFDMAGSYPVMEAGLCKGVITESKSGREFFPAAVVVDATGDADILSRAGVPCVLHGNNFLSVVTMRASLDTCRRAAESGDILQMRTWFGGGSDLFGNGQPEGVPPFSGVTNEEVTAFLLAGRKLIFDKVKDEDRRSRDIITLPGMAQFRKTRRIQGDWTLQESDVYRHFEDSIGAVGDFTKRGQRFEIPYRCLRKAGFPNLLAAGRVVSADGRGWEVIRVIPVAAMTGQAAGTAAALAVRHQMAVDKMEISLLQQTLASNQVQIHIPKGLDKPTMPAG